METSNIVTATEYEAGKLEIIVETKYAESFRKFLTDKGVNCSLLGCSFVFGTLVGGGGTKIIVSKLQCGHSAVRVSPTAKSLASNSMWPSQFWQRQVT